MPGAAKPSLSATLRAKQVLALAGLDPATPLVPALYTSNEVWFAGEHVLRIAPASRQGRAQLEAHLASVLPADVPHAPVIAHGRAAVGEWVVMDRMPGRPLSEAWPGLDPAGRRGAIADLARGLRRLHAVHASVEIIAMVASESPHPIPASRTLGLVQRARSLPHVRSAVLDGLVALLHEVGDALDPRDSYRGLVHGDLHFDNLLFADGRITAFLDLEWMRPGPPDLDLDILLEYCAAPELTTQAIDRFAVTSADLAPVPRWLEQDYPELFSHPRIDDRLLLYRIAYDIQALLNDPPGPDVAALPHHPYNRLRRLAGMP